MTDFNKKKNYKKIIHSPGMLFLFLLILLVLLKALWGVYQKEMVSARNLTQEQEELNKVAARSKDLASSIEYLKTDQGIEAEIRNKFRVVKGGESVAIIVDDGDASTTQPSATSTPSLWQKFLNMLH